MASVPVTAQKTGRTLLYLYGSATQIELKNYLETVSIDDAAHKAQILTGWREATKVFKEIMANETGVPETITCSPLEATDLERAQDFMLTQQFAATFGGYPCTIELVELDKLVACQRNIHMDHVNGLIQDFKATNGDLFSFCLDPKLSDVPVRVARTATNAFTLAGLNPNLRFLGAYEQPYKPEYVLGEPPSGHPVHTITIVVGFGSSTANAYKLPSGRIILSNGFHRVFALRSLGIEKIPLLIQHITHPELELPPVLAELNRDHLVEAPRPALIRDFLDSRLVCNITQAKFLKSIQVGWGVQESNVPT
jgi:hypothetical protein